MSVGTGDEYRPTYFDKHGPEAAAYWKIASFLLIPTVGGALVGTTYFAHQGYSTGGVIAGGLVGGVLAGAGSALFVISVSENMGAVFRAFIQPDHSPHQRQYSYEDSLVMRGDVEGALTSYEKIILESPNDAVPRLRAADLCAKSQLHDRAETLFRAVQRLPQVNPRDDIYASNRLVDLYLAWPGNEAKSLRELRRLVDTYPATDVAERARAGLANLKSQLGVTE
jgi:tetratricopeptide (TPR) repeat protein